MPQSRRESQRTAPHLGQELERLIAAMCDGRENICESMRDFTWLGAAVTETAANKSSRPSR